MSKTSVSEVTSSPPSKVPPRPLWRRLGVWLRRGLLVALVLITLAVVSLRSQSVRQSLLSHLADVITTRNGMVVEIEDFELSLLGGRLEIQSIVLRAGPEDAPFLESERAVASWLWPELLASRPRLDTVIISAPKFDLTAPLPSGSKEEPTAPPEEMDLGFDLTQFRLENGSVAQSWTEPKGWLAGWRLHSLDGEGHYEDGEIRFASPDSRLQTTLSPVAADDAAAPSSVRRYLQAPEITLNFRLRGRLPSFFEVETLQAEGDGLRLSASGTYEPENQNVQTRFDLFADPARLLPEVAAGAGEIRATGDLDLHHLVGQVDLGIEHLPIALLEPAIDASTYRLVAIPDSFLGSQLELTLQGPRAGQMSGRGTLRWARPRRTGTTEDLLRLQVETLAPGAEDRLRLGFDLELLPDLDSTVTARGSLSAADWQSLGTANLDQSTSRVEVDDPQVLRRQLIARWPGLAAILPTLEDSELAPLSPSLGPLKVKADAKGPLNDPRLDVQAEAVGGTMQLTAQGRPSRQQVNAELRLSDFPLATLQPLIEPSLRGDLDLSLDLVVPGKASKRAKPEPWDVRVSASVRQLDYDTQIQLESLQLTTQGTITHDSPSSDTNPLPFQQLDLQAEGYGLTFAEDQPSIEQFNLQAQLQDTQWTVESLNGQWGDLEFSSQIEATVSRLQDALRFDRIHLAGRVDHRNPEDDALPFGPLRLAGLRADVEIAEGLLALRFDEVTSKLGAGTLQANVPLANLGRFPQLAPLMASLPMKSIGGAIELKVDWPHLDTVELLETLNQPPAAVQAQAAVLADLQIDFSQPQLSSGRFVLDQFRVENEEHLLEGDAPLQLNWANQRLVLEPATLEIEGKKIRLSAQADVRWQDLDDVPVPVPTLEAWRGRAEGKVDTDLLRPYLPSASRADGALNIEAQLSGSLQDPRVEMKVTHDQARLLLTDPYTVSITKPEVALTYADGVLDIEDASAAVNGGTATGHGQLDAEGNFTMQGVFDTLRMRLDYGVIAVLSGNYTYAMPASGRAKLTSNVLLERAVMRHDIDLDGLLLSSLFAPPEIVGLQAPRSEDDIDLELSIATIDGLRVRNNLANLRATWNPISVRGSVQYPLIRGDVDVEPEGLISAYGVTVRLDQAQVTFPGVPGAAPIIEVATTSSLEDPTIGQGRADLFASNQGQRDISAQARLTQGLAGHYANQLAGKLGSGLGSRTRLSFRPVLIFGESDPEARLALTRDLSANLSLAVAISLQDTQSRTYVLDLHQLPQWPAFVAQAFTTEEEQAGLTVQHSWEPGKAALESPEGSLQLGQLHLQAPEFLPLKDLRNTINVALGDQIGDGADFDVEVDLADTMHRLGYRAAQIEVRLVNGDRDSNTIDLEVDIEPGTRSEFKFIGAQPARSQRRSIERLYRPALQDHPSFGEMRERTIEVFRARGFSQPSVTITSENLIDKAGLPLRQIVVDVEPGEKLELKTPRFEGLSPEVTGFLEERFTTRLQRIELALGTEAAQEHTLSVLRGLGFVEPQWISSRYDPDTESPVAVVEAIKRRRIASFEVVGLLDKEAGLVDTTPFKAGSSLRSDLLTQAALIVESNLRNSGYADATATVNVTPLEDDELEFAVTLEIDRGPGHRLRDVRVSGQNHTRPGWIARIADLDRDPLLQRSEITLARRRLLASGVFRRVQILTEAGELLPGKTDTGFPMRATDIVIDVQERPRYRVSTGLRWESSTGVSAVVDVLDRSFTQRGTNLGFRALAGEREQVFKVYTVIPRVLASPFDLQLFVEHSNRDTAGITRERLEGSFQLSRRLGLRNIVRAYGAYREGLGPEVDSPTGPLATFRNPFLGVQWVLGEQQPDQLFPDSAFASFDLSFSSEGLGADQDFARFFSNLQYFYRREDTPWIWGQSLRLGWADAFGETLIDDLRFRSGGEFSVRGYSTESLGTRVLSDDGRLIPIGGEALMVLNQEVRFPLPFAGLAGLVFFDVGNVWSDKDDFGRDFASSLGLGLRYDSPVGPLRLDVAYPLDRRPGDGEVKFYFGFGNIF